MLNSHSHQMEDKENASKKRDPKRELSYLIAQHCEKHIKTIESCSPLSFSPLSETLSIKVECGDSICDDRICQFDYDSDEEKGEITK